MLWTGQLLSDSGSEVGMLAYPLLILALTHSAVLAGVVGTAREIALIGLQLPVFTPASTAALPGIVPDSQLQEAWAATEARTWGAGLAGPVLGGVLFQHGSSDPHPSMSIAQTTTL
jgi:hypothetical protein